MFKYFSDNNTRKYIDVLDLLVDQYNNTIHSSIKLTSIEESRGVTRIKFGEIYFLNFVERSLARNFLLVIMFE